MSFEIQGLPINVELAPDTPISRISFRFTFRMDRRLLQVSRPSTLYSSITVGTASAAFTCVLRFTIDPGLEECDVVLGSEWKDACDAGCNFPLSLATIPVYEDVDRMDCSDSEARDITDAPADVQCNDSEDKALLHSLSSGSQFSSSSESTTESQNSNTSFSYENLPFYPFRRRMDNLMEGQYSFTSTKRLG